MTKGSKRVNRKCKLDADKGNGYTTRVTTLFPSSKSKVKNSSWFNCVGIKCCRLEPNKAWEMSLGGSSVFQVEFFILEEKFCYAVIQSRISSQFNCRRLELTCRAISSFGSIQSAQLQLWLIKEDSVCLCLCIGEGG